MYNGGREAYTRVCTTVVGRHIPRVYFRVVYIPGVYLRVVYIPGYGREGGMLGGVYPGMGERGGHAGC